MIQNMTKTLYEGRTAGPITLQRMSDARIERASFVWIYNFDRIFFLLFLLWYIKYRIIIIFPFDRYIFSCGVTP